MDDKFKYDITTPLFVVTSFCMPDNCCQSYSKGRIFMAIVCC